MDDAENKTIEQSVEYGVDDHNLYRLITNQQKSIAVFTRGEPGVIMGKQDML